MRQKSIKNTGKSNPIKISRNKIRNDRMRKRLEDYRSLTTNDKRKILIVHNYYQIPGGEDTVVANEKKMLENYGHKVILYSRNNSELKKMSILRKLALPLTTIFNLHTYMDIRRLIKEQKIEIVHVHNTLNLISAAVYYAAVSMKVPVIQTVHNFRLLCPGATLYRDNHICEDCIEQGLGCALKHQCYRGSWAQTLVCIINMKIHRATKIYSKLNYICLTEFNREKLLKLEQIEENRVYIKPNFTFDIEAKKEKDDFYLYIGRIEEIKGISLLIEAFSRIPGKKLQLVGVGPEFQYYNNIVLSNRLLNIKFNGFMERKELSELLKSAKAVIVTSQCYETFGMMIIEAFAAHTPVIVGDIGNVGNLVNDGINGIKFQYNSADALISAIKRFESLDNSILGENAYQKYVKNFTMGKNYFLLNKIYSEICKDYYF